LMFGGQVSCIPRVMPKCHALSASYTDSAKGCTGWAFGCILYS